MLSTPITNRGLASHFTEDVAQKAGMSQQKYSKIERGEAPATEEELGKIAEALQVESDILTTFDENTIFSNCHINNAFAYNGTYHN